MNEIGIMMKNEIAEQPKAIMNCKESNAKLIKEVAKASRNVKSIILAARGSSDHACNYFKYLCEIYAGIPVGFAAPSVITEYDGKINMKNCLVIGVSQSGKAADVIEVLKRARLQGAVTLAITNDANSELGLAAKYHAYLNVGEEKSVAATKTFLAELYVLAMLTVELSYNKELRAQINSVPKMLRRVLVQGKKIGAIAKQYIDVADCYVLARGINYAAAQEAALKIQETTYIKAKAYAISDFHHGPFAVVDSKTNVILLANSGKSVPDTTEMLIKLKSTGAKILVITDDEIIAKEGTSAIILPKVAESIAPFAYVACSQIFARALSILRGIDPDNPRGLKKVTITK